MKLFRKRIVLTLLVILALLALIWYSSRPEPVPVILKQIDRGIVEATVANTRAGTVMACGRAKLAPAIGGQIAKLHVAEGDWVEAGQILLEMWNDDLAAELSLAKQEVNAVKDRAEEACVIADVADAEAKRSTQLRKQGLASEEQTERAIGDAKARRAACRAAQASIGVSRARIDVVKATLERTILRAPFAGSVAEINGEVGEFVTPSPIGVATPPAVDLIDNRCLYVSAPIDEVDAPSITAGMETRITMDAFPDQHFPGAVRRVAPYVLDLEKQARTVDVTADFANPENIIGLLAGYSADIEVILETKPDVIRIPTEAIRENHKALVYNPEDQTLSERDIKTGISNWVFTEVLSGLTPGELVVTSADREGIEPGAFVTPEDNRN